MLAAPCERYFVSHMIEDIIKLVRRLTVGLRVGITSECLTRVPKFQHQIYHLTLQLPVAWLSKQNAQTG